VELVGYIGRDAQLNGNITRMGIAVRNAWKGGEWQGQKRIRWIPLVGFGTQSVVRSLTKGAHVKSAGACKAASSLLLLAQNEP
jgi:hypothetical protein